MEESRDSGCREEGIAASRSLALSDHDRKEITCSANAGSGNVNLSSYVTVGHWDVS